MAQAASRGGAGGVIPSMTGAAFGRHPGDDRCGALAIELRSVNGRGLTVKCRLPAELLGCERAIEERVRARITRGTIFVTVACERGQSAAGVVDPARFAAAAELLRRLASEAGLQAPTMHDVLLVPGVLGASQPGRELRDGPGDEAPPALLDALDATLEQLVAAREAEGRSLAGVLAGLLDELERGLAVVNQRAPLLAQRYREKLLARVGEVLAAHAARLEPSDVAQQVALFADKADVTEEIERLRSHLARARAMLAAGGAVGRSLEFLIQEMLREVNTIGSKSPDVEIAHEVVAMKSTVDRLKEQVANLE
jgi:uncharacterized protein (TIGR00255 family)